MADFILVDGDNVTFTPVFGGALVTVKPCNIKGTGLDTVLGRKMCVEGDEKLVAVHGCPYTRPPFAIPGVGVIKIKQLGPNQIARQKKTANGKRVLLVGSGFQASFEVLTPAMMPPPSGAGAPIPDSLREYIGRGQFMTTNRQEKAE